MMSPVHRVSAKEIAEHVRRAYGLQVTGMSVPEGRAHADAAVYRVEASRRAYFLKLTPEERSEPPPLARHLADKGIAEVLAPLRTLDGHLSSRLGEAVAVLFPFVEGDNGFLQPLSDEQWIALGRVVRSIHETVLPSEIAATMRVEAYSDRWRRETMRCLAIEPSVEHDDVARPYLEFLDVKRSVITRLVEHAAELAVVVAGRELPFVPCHGDLHAGNVLVRDDGSLTIVDWDDPVLAPKERDLMFVGAGIGGAWHRDEEAAAFYRGYGDVPVDREAVAYYRCERFVEDVAVFTAQILESRDDARGVMLGKFKSAFDANDVVQIAERTFAAL
jgi:spectinomycin phosphotransferase